MKNLFLIFIFFMNTVFTYSQELSKKEIEKLNLLEINTSTINLYDANTQKKLNNILKLDKKRKTNKIVAIVLTSLAASSVLLGSATLNSTDNVITEVLGGTLIGSGVVYGAISIPFWNASKKRKKERDRLIIIFDK